MANVNRTEFEKAMKAALEGPELKGYSLIKHGFNVKPCQRTGDGTGALLIKGQLSHRLRGRTDDQLHYAFRVVAGERVTIDQVEVTINRSLVDRIAKFVAEVLWEWIMEELEKAFASSTQALASRPEDAKTDIFEESKVLLKGGKWEDAANFIIVNVAGRLAIGEAQRVVAKQTPQPAPRPTTPGRVTRGEAGRVVVRDHRTT